MIDEVIIINTYNHTRWVQIIPQAVNYRAIRYENAELCETRRFDDIADAERWAGEWVGGTEASIRKDVA